MTRPPAPAPPTSRDDAVALISAYGAFRLLIALLAVWTFFSGFALLTHAVGALSFGGDGPGDRVAGAQMLLLVPVYALIVWRRDEYRLLLWIPYAAQLAIILPVILNFVLANDRDIRDGMLQLVVAFIFLALLIYLWRESHPLGFFSPEEEEDEEEWEEEEEDPDAEDDIEEEEEYDEEEIEEEPDEEPPPKGRFGRR